MKRTIEIEDTLQECVDSAIESVKEHLTEYLKENPDMGALPCLNNDLNDDGAINEIIDGSVPVYTKEIEDNFYLHGNKIEQAFDNAGFDNKNDEEWPMGWKAAAIFCYIKQEVNAWYRDNAAEIFKASKEKTV